MDVQVSRGDVQFGSAELLRGGLNQTGKGHRLFLLNQERDTDCHRLWSGSTIPTEA